MDMLSSSTLSDVTKFVESQMRTVPVDEIRENMVSEGTQKHAPKFTVDGYGRWREVGGKQDVANRIIPCLRDAAMLDVYKRLISEEEGVAPPLSSYNSNCSPPSTASQKDTENDSRLATSGQRPRANAPEESYKHLSTSLRSNVFPGIGKNNWESSAKTAYIDKSLPVSWKKPQAHFAITKDEYMDWAEHAVHRQKLVKAWDKYMADAPKPERQVPIKKKAKEGENPKKPVKKEVKKKSKEKKNTVNVDKEAKKDEVNKDEIQTRRIEVQPANPDDDFWDFYEKPFAQ